MHISTKRNTFYIFNILISLVVGLIVYVCYRPDTHVSQIVYNVLGISADCIATIDVLPTWLLLFARNYLGDISWAYALTFTICYIWLGTGGRMIHVFGIVATFETGIEILQMVDIIPGTFDWWDILVEICITAFSMLLIKTIHKENRT